MPRARETGLRGGWMGRGTTLWGPWVIRQAWRPPRGPPFGRWLP